MTMSMNELVASFRKIAEDAERQARSTGIDRSTQANLIDAAAKCHWLAGEASALCSKLGQVPAACERCSEKCPQPAGERFAGQVRSALAASPTLTLSANDCGRTGGRRQSCLIGAENSQRR